MSVDVLELVDGRSPLVVGHGRWAGQLASRGRLSPRDFGANSLRQLGCTDDSRSFDSVADSLREAATALRMTNFREG
jgi:hypothetical protein